MRTLPGVFVIGLAVASLTSCNAESPQDKDSGLVDVDPSATPRDDPFMRANAGLELQNNDDLLRCSDMSAKRALGYWRGYFNAGASKYAETHGGQPWTIKDALERRSTGREHQRDGTLVDSYDRVWKDIAARDPSCADIARRILRDR